MDFIKDDINKLYWTYLRASVFSALVISIYSFVDTIAVGQSEGPIGTAAMAIINPFYGLAAFLGLLCGIGGSVLMSSTKTRGNEEEGNRWFTSGMILTLLVSVITWAVFLLFPDQIFTFFGADETTLPKVKEYASLITAFTPIFIFPMSLAAYVRNDGSPAYATAAVIIGSAVNIFGDWFFVFPLGMGMRGAALATVIGNSTQTVIILSYLFRKKCHLKFRRPARLWRSLGSICSVGVGSAIPDLGSLVISIIMNNQIMRYSGSTALSVYGAVCTIMALFQTMFGGVGQAVQPLVSSNYAVKKRERINRVMRLAAATTGVMSIVFFAVGELFPKQITSIFMDTTEEVLAMAPTVMRPFFPVFLFMGINVLLIYYLQSVMENRAAMVLSLGRSVVLTGILLFVLPLFLGFTGVLIALPVSECIVAICSIAYTKKIQPKLYQEQG